MAAVRVVLLLGVFLFCLTEVSSDIMTEEQLPHLGQAKKTKIHALFLFACCERWKQKANARHRLWRVVQAEVQRSLEAKDLQQGLRYVLCEMQVCATWHFWEQRTLWQVLH
ncbi:uncharacterized protein LOC110766912 isoform X2 [Prunus avium]|uniref:Uncharacterized protein LOC110766912 isoform X2 n=1 Tax=Prunus avium TaxID=42229 RepID=A0A6P5TG54_PRUAV|nr:uncharacterized protein LOC110766912 isoform X2 [Prunus avium]